ncbi:MAG: adenylate/guanylate cyclase domain-containing protein, partial [Treponema sp.]|nr:adenylate/guanylate cyclase domain-containing protein [Treponema sp.]
MGKIPNKNRKKKVRATLRFSIRGKLILIIGIIVLASLGSITGLVSWLFRQDLRITAEDNNFEVNRRSALETENFLVNIRNNSQILLQTTSALGYGSNLANQTVEYFFSQNKQVAALLLVSEPGKSNLLVNKRFFETLDIDPSPVETFVQNYEASLVRAASGETIILNVAEWFKTPLLTMFFPWQNGAGAAIFSSTDLNDNFGIGPNQSYLINDSGDILVHPEYDLVRGAVNVSENFLTILIYNSSQKNAQVLYTDEDNIRFFGAYSKLNIGGAVVITKIEFSKVFEGIDATTRR